MRTIIYEVTPLKLKEIDFGATGEKEILQNVAFILATVTDSCPLDREFGWETDVDSPINLSIATNASRIIQAINDYEPRANVEEVRFEGEGLEGKLVPIVKVSINGEV